MQTRHELIEQVNACLTGAGIPSYTELRDELCRLDSELERGRVAMPRLRRIIFNTLTTGSSDCHLLVVKVNGISVSPELRREALEQANALLIGAGMPSYIDLRNAMGQASIELELGRLAKPKAWRERLGALIENSSAQGGKITTEKVAPVKSIRRRGQRLGYEVRVVAAGMVFSKQAGRKLYGRRRALRISRFLQKRGVDASIAPILIASSQPIAS